MDRSSTAVLAAFASGLAVAGASRYLYEQALPGLKRRFQNSNDEAQDSGFSLEALVRPNILSLKPYRCARDDYSEGILLDANENSLGPPVHTETAELERYPSPYQWELKELIARKRGVSKEEIFLGVGSDEAIDILFRIFCTPGKDSILTTPPTYGMYSVCADINDVKVINVPLTPEFQIEAEKIVKAVAPETKIIFLCSPGNPTAKLLRSVDIIYVLEHFSGIVVVDEAYIDFAEEDSMCSYIRQYPNLVVLQTLSKAYGLAGIRLGMAFGRKELIQIMNNVKAPYNINKLTSEIAIQALRDSSELQAKIDEIKRERGRVMAALAKFDTVGKIHPSDTNFILFEVMNAFDVYKTMADRGVVVRYRGNLIHCKDCLRMTIGTKDENDAFLVLFEKVSKEIAGGKKRS